MSLTGGDIFYYCLKPPVRYFLKTKFNIQVQSNPLEKVNEPYLLLGPHVSNEDPIICNAYSNRLIRYIAGDANQDSLLKKVLLAILESIPFMKNRGDAKAIRKMLNHVRCGHPLGLYPEGGRNWDGVTDTLVPSTAKLIKLLKIPVYAAFLKGGYLSRPRWASYPRKGKLVLEIKRIFDRDTVLQKSAEDLYGMLVEKLNYSEYDWQAQNRIAFTGKNLAEHIQRLLYICPNCTSVDTIESGGNEFYCTACKAEYSIDQYGDIHGCPSFKNPAAWNKWQRTHLPRLIGEGFAFANPGMSVEKRRAGSKREKYLTDLTLYPSKLTITGLGIDDALDLGDITSHSITFQDFVEFYVGKIKYRLIFDPRRHMSVKLFYDLLTTVTGKG